MSDLTAWRPADAAPDAAPAAEAYLAVQEEPSVPLSPDELDELIATDPTWPRDSAVEPPPAPKGKRGSRLSQQQQLQLALWIVEGWRFKDAAAVMQEQWGFAVSAQAWSYYRTARQDLLEAALKLLDAQYLRFGFSSKSVQVKKLSTLASRLERIMDSGGLYETEVHYIHSGGAGKPKPVTSQKFNSAVAEQYRKTLDQIQKLTAPVQAALDRANGKGGVTVELDAAAAERLFAAASWGANQAQLPAGAYDDTPALA